jgi:predicted nuclease with RNAse H fold
MPTSTPSRPPEAALTCLPPEAVSAALSAHGAEAALALGELGANPALPRLAACLGPANIGRLLVEAPLDLSQALDELAPRVGALERLHALSLRPDMLGRIFARSLPSFMKGMREITRRGIEASLAEFEGLLPEAARRRPGPALPEARAEAETLLAILEGALGREEPPPSAGLLPVGCEVEVPNLAGYPAGGAYVLALWAGLPLGEDELIEFSLPPWTGATMQVRLIDALWRLALLPENQTLSLHITCETPQAAAASNELQPGMRLVSFCLAFLYSADRRLAAGQIFKNFRLKRRGIQGLRWPRALGAEYRLGNVCTGAGEPGVAGDSRRAHEAAIRLAERLHEALIAYCVTQSGPWERFRNEVDDWLETSGLAELARREHNITGELATLFAGGRTAERQHELLGIVGEHFG